MRKFIFLALMGLLSAMLGCGVVRDVVSDTCTGSYNRFVCPDKVDDTEFHLIRDVNSCNWARSRFVVRWVRGRRTAVSVFRSDGLCIAERKLVQAAAKKAPGLSCQWTKAATNVVCR